MMIKMTILELSQGEGRLSRRLGVDSPAPGGLPRLHLPPGDAQLPPLSLLRVPGQALRDLVQGGEEEDIQVCGAHHPHVVESLCEDGEQEESIQDILF